MPPEETEQHTTPSSGVKEDSSDQTKRIDKELLQSLLMEQGIKLITPTTVSLELLDQAIYKIRRETDGLKLKRKEDEG